MDWQKILYPGLWCMLFMIFGLQVWIVKMISGSVDQILIIGYYGCAVAALVALCFLVIGVAKFIAEGEPSRT
jgi:hypothetical protein